MSQIDIEELGLGINSMNLEDFKKALIRVAILGQDLLGGSKGESLEVKLNQNGSKPPMGRSRGKSSQQSASSLRTRLAKQNSLSEIKAAAATSGGNETDRKEGTLPRKTKEQKILRDLTMEKERHEKIMLGKIEDKRMSKAFDVSIITAQTVEALLKYIQLN